MFIVLALAQNSTVQDCLRGRDVKLRVTFLKCIICKKIINEGLRLYSPAEALAAVLATDCVIQNVFNEQFENRKLHANELVTVSPYFAGRDPKIWGETANEFAQQNRWERENLNFLNLPFGYGAHGCLGQQLALHETKLYLTRLSKILKLAPH